MADIRDQLGKTYKTWEGNSISWRSSSADKTNGDLNNRLSRESIPSGSIRVSSRWNESVPTQETAIPITNTTTMPIESSVLGRSGNQQSSGSELPVVNKDRADGG